MTIRVASLRLGSLLVVSVGSANGQAQSPGRFVDVERGRLYAEDCGTGATTLVLVHDGLVHSAVLGRRVAASL